jgi:hypothetical protein
MIRFLVGLLRHRGFRLVTVSSLGVLVFAGIAIAIYAYVAPENKLATGLVGSATGIALTLAALTFMTPFFSAGGSKQEELAKELSRLRADLLTECKSEISLSTGGEAYEVIPTSYHTLDIGLSRAKVIVDRSAGTENDLYELFVTQTISHRLVICGEPGAGKSVLLRQLQARFLGDPAFSQQLPIVLRMGSWDQRMDLRDWVAQQISNYRVPRQVAYELAGPETALLLLDGLDEMNSGEEENYTAETEAIKSLNTSGIYKIIVATRYETIPKVISSSGYLDNAIVVKIDPITPDEAIKIIHKEAQPSPQRTRLVDIISEEPDGDLAQVLSTKLYLRMATAGLREGSLDVSLLVVSQGDLPNEGVKSIQAQILKSIVDFAQLRPRPRRWRKNVKRYSTDQIYRWSRSLAQYLVDYGGTIVNNDRIPTNLLIPHRLWPIMGVKRGRVAVALLTTLLWLPLACTLPIILNKAVISDGSRLIMFAGVVAFTVLAWTVSIGSARPVRVELRRLFTYVGAVRLLIGCTSALLAMVFSKLYISGTFGVPYAAGAFLVFGLGLAAAVRPDVDLPTVTLVGTGCMLGIEPEAHAITMGTSASLQLIIGIAAGGISLGAAELAGSYAWNPEQAVPFTQKPKSDPYETLHTDIQTAILFAVIPGCLTFFAAWHTALFHASFLEALSLAVATSLAAGPGFLAVGWRRYVAMLLLSGRQLPLRLEAFMKWLHLSGILRQSASAYQFRHDALQKYFLSDR